MSEPKHIGSFFQRRPSEGVKPQQWRIKRCGATEKLIGVCLSHDIFGCYTHWYRGRTMPCVDEKTCEACLQGVEKRWHSWFAGMLRNSEEKLIIEITARSVEPFDTFFCEHRTLRGANFELSRPSSRKNGKVHVRLKMSAVPSEQLPKAGGLEQMLLRMWEVPETLTLPLSLDRPGKNDRKAGGA
jgi:hypothetical protein